MVPIMQIAQIVVAFSEKLNFIHVKNIYVLKNQSYWLI